MSVPVICHIGIGANLGDARGQVQSAIAQLGQLPDTRLERAIEPVL